MAGRFSGYFAILLFCCASVCFASISLLWNNNFYGSVALFWRGLAHLSCYRNRKLLCGNVTCAACLWGKRVHYGNGAYKGITTTKTDIY